MNNRFNVLCVVAFLAFCVALAAVQAAKASTPRDAERVLWYLRGQLQLATNERGWAILELGCRPRPTGRWVYCWTRVYIPSARKMFCQHALYRTTGDTLTGLRESTPKPCTRAQRQEPRQQRQQRQQRRAPAIASTKRSRAAAAPSSTSGAVEASKR